WRSDAPGVTRKITPADIPPRGASPVGVALASVVDKPSGARLKAPPGFHVEAFAKLDSPRLVRVAPNGDIFVAESEAGRIRVLRAHDGAAKPSQVAIFAAGLSQPFGIAFYPPGPNPQWVYVANANSVVRFAYRNGDLKARSAAETVVGALPPGRGHSTRDIAFSTDGRIMLVSVGSRSNAAEDMTKKAAGETKAWQASHALGAAWGPEENRADVLAFDPDGHGQRVFAAGLRNCVTIAVEPRTGAPWCAVNERDMLGDDLPPDYVTRVRQGAFYGWPWYYIGDHQDPRHAGQRPDLAGKVMVPDVLIQPHSAPLGLAFYNATSGPAAFPADDRGQAFVALHGSWNRAKRTGYKVVRIVLKNGVPTGEYQDFLTGFVIDDRRVWGRPVGVAVAHDGALLVTDDAGDTLWRIAYGGH
ncbi:MAG TPA: PQQ-dependent sugar dehydrogenase, partial [Caulobacteraceae bacterium]|nr:PQQ-dependent sugar dehydrogenase [Caulobacteraceae bacterium]